MKKTKQIETVTNSHNYYKDKIKSLGIDSYSGRGSCIDTTEDIRKHLPIIIEKFNVKSIIDSPCGDWNWMKLVNLENINYVGYDILDEILDINKEKYSKKNINFVWKDLLEDSNINKVDLIICRDFLFHINNNSVSFLLDKFKSSGSKYLLSTSFEKTNINVDIRLEENEYGYRPINLLKEPFNLESPIYSFLEEHVDNNGRGMYLWELNK